jgi:hypothetical protein
VTNAAVLLVYVAVIGFVLVRQFVKRTVSARGFILVAVLVADGAVNLAIVPGGPVGAGIAVLALELPISVGFGVVRGYAMRVWRDDAGVAWRQGNVRTLVWWLLTILSRLALGAVAGVGWHVPFNGGSVLLGFGVTLAAQQVVLLKRARALSPATAQ